MPRALLNNPDWASESKAPLVQELPAPSVTMQESTASSSSSSGPANGVKEMTNAHAEKEKKPKSILKTATPVVGTGAGGKRPLIEEVASMGANSGSGLDVKKLAELLPLRWRWEKNGERLRIEVDVPGLVSFNYAIESHERRNLIEKFFSTSLHNRRANSTRSPRSISKRVVFCSTFLKNTSSTSTSGFLTRRSGNSARHHLLRTTPRRMHH